MFIIKSKLSCIYAIRTVKIIGVLFALCAFTFISCKASYPDDKNVIARVGNNVLLRSEVEHLIPSGTPSSDSIAMIQQYINSWALKYLLITKAEKEMPDVHNSINREIDDYRNSLIAYRYEKRYIEQRLDTLVSENEGRQYYFDNQDDFILKNSVVKSRIIKISPSSPNLARIKSMYKVEEVDEVSELERICYNSADRYTNFDNQWIDLSVIVGELLPINIDDAERQIKIRNYIEVRDSLYNYMAFFPEIVSPDHVAPFEFYQQRIKEIIIGKRKQELLDKLEKDLIREALNNNTIITTINKRP